MDSLVTDLQAVKLLEEGPCLKKNLNILANPEYYR